MPEYLVLMHNDRQTDSGNPDDWLSYIDRLVKAGVMRGGSAIGNGQSYRKAAAAAPITTSIDGYLKITAESLEAATAILAGNPTFEAGGTVEIRELPETD